MLNFDYGIDLLSDVDCDSSIEERCKCFKDNYLAVVSLNDKLIIENPFHSMAYISNIIGSVCDEEDYEFDEDEFLTDTCQAIMLSDKLDEALINFNINSFKEAIKEYLLKNEKYELLNEIKDA